MLTGRDTDMLILNQLSDKDLAAVCSTDRTAKSFCESQSFWKARTIAKYGPEALPDFMTEPIDYKKFYQSGQVVAYWICQRIPKRSQLVVDDFYNPETGFYSKYWTRDVDGLTLLLLKTAYVVDNLFHNNEQDDHDSSRGTIYNQKLQELIKEKLLEIPEWRQEEFGQDFFLTEKDRKTFKDIINVNPGAPAILRSRSRGDSQFLRAVSPDPIKTFRFIDYIHKGFQSGQLDMTLTWSELCRHSYVLNY